MGAPVRISIRRSARLVAIIGFALGLGIAWAHAAELVETFDPGKSKERVLGGILLTGKDGPWDASLGDGTYTLRNSTDAQAIKYFSINGFSGDADGLGEASVAVDVDIGDGGGLSGAGIIYRFDPANRTYLLFALMSTNEYAAFVRGANGFKPLAKGTVANLHEGQNRLAVQASGDRIEFLINDVQAVAMQIQGKMGQSVGIAAIGKGTFVFDNFSIKDRG